MAIGLNGYLGTGAGGEFFRDWQHAARLYVDDTYRLAPKPKWMHYAVFNINEAAIGNTSFRDQNRRELNYLVKKMDLPKYTLNVENLNQYNRKTKTYTSITYEPVNITFHDDNNGVTNAMWALYYGYYFADRLNTATPYTDIDPVAYRPHTYDTKTQFPFRYGLDNLSTSPFFSSIQLLTLSKQKFTSYLLCNPKITSWQHDTMDQSEGNGVVENNMSVVYDAVIYTTGTIAIDNPSGFAVLHYDQAQSPLGPDNQSKLQGAAQPVFDSQGLYPNNSFNPIDSSISMLQSLAVNPFLGNQLPYGYGNNLFVNPLYSNYTTSGLSNYNFTSTNTLTSALDSATARNINPVQFAPIDPSYNNGANARAEAINEQFSATIKSSATNGSPVASDVYSINLPKNSASANESKIFNNTDSGKNLPEPIGPVNMDYFIDSDVTTKNYIVDELITNNPQAQDIPSDPFK